MHIVRILGPSALLRKSSRAIGSRFGEENSVESRAELPVDEEPENRHHQTRRDAGRIHQQMEEQNVDDQRPGKSQRQRNGSSKQEQRAGNHLQSKDKPQLVRRRQGCEILYGCLRRGRLHGEKVQKAVQTKNDENERDQLLRDDGSDLHKVFLLGMSSSGNDAGFIKTETGAARVKLCSIAVADVAKKVRLSG